VPFRNEVANLPSLLASFECLQFSNHKVEFIFINDHSSDGGDLVIKNYTGNLIVKLIDSKSQGKKNAMREAWQHCEGNVILQTDADCIVPINWINVMLAPFQKGEVILAAGPVDFFEESSFWKRLVRLDFQALIAIGAAHIAWQKPMICNAANLAYRKELIDKATLNDDMASGDDVFLLQSAYKMNSENGIAFVKSMRGIVKTAGPATFSEFWHQRLRWASKNGAYDIRENTWILAGVWLYNVLILLCVVTASALSVTIALFLIILKVLAEDKFYSRFQAFFGKELWFTNLLLGQPFHILYMAIVPPLSQVLKYQWKERKLR